MDISTFEEDLLGLKSFAEKLENFIKVENRYVPESLVISLNGGFGSGKSTFFKMWTDSLSKKEDPDDRILVVGVNAWNDDYCGDPLVSLISALIECLIQKDKDTDSLLEVAKNVGWLLTGMGNQVVKKFTGVDVIKAGELADQKESERKGDQYYSGIIFDVYNQKKRALESLKSAIRDVIHREDQNILILVDELDRCRPDYAISYLETIKHVFDIKGLIFILAVDRSQLECSAKATFGSGLNFPEYYRKFVHREVLLPYIKAESYRNLASKYVDYYLQNENERHCFMNFDYHRINDIVDLISCMKMTPRQIQEAFRIMGHVFETEESNKGHLCWCLGEGSILMSALRIGNPDIYNKLGKQELDISEAATFFMDLGVNHPDWWFTLCYTGKGLNPKQIENREPTDIFREARFISEGEEIKRDFGQWSSGWGHSTANRFPQIYSIIEEVSSWN